MNLRILVLSSLLIAAFGLSAHADSPVYLLTIDLTDPTDVTITATGNFATENSSVTSEGDGIDLLQFFSSSVVTDPTEVSNLTPSGGSGPYDSWTTDDYTAPSSYVDLNVFADNEFSSSTQTFTTGSAAFTGSYPGIDLSAYEGSLPTVGSYGDILAGYSESADGVIGQWVVVPEPSQYGFLIVLAVAGLITVKRVSRTVPRPVQA